jgi:predicted dehydrogenase
MTRRLTSVERYLWRLIMPQAVFALVGTGQIAQTQHLPNLMRAPHIRLKTLCERNDELLRKMHTQYPVPCATTDHRQVLADPEVQAVVICTKEDAQAGLTIEALNAGKHVYVEKPLAATPEECQAVVEAQEKSGRHVAVGFNRRFAPAYQKARECVKRHGGAHNIHYRVATTAWRWHKSKPMSRTRVLTELCHVFDFLRWFTSSEIRTVYCVEARPDDEAYALKLSSGCVATIMSTGYATVDLPKERLEVISEKGGVVAEEFAELRTYGYPDFDHVYRFPGHSHPGREFGHKYLFEQLGAEADHALRRMAWELQCRLESDSTLPDVERAAIREYLEKRAPIWNYMGNKGWLDALDHLAQCILENRVPDAATARDALAASRVGHAALRSREEGQAINVETPGCP